MDDNLDLKQVCIDTVRANGDLYLMHSEVCTERKRIKLNCNGCESESGCKKVMQLMLLGLKQSLDDQQTKDIELILAGKGDEVNYDCC